MRSARCSVGSPRRSDRCAPTTNPTQPKDNTMNNATTQSASIAPPTNKVFIIGQRVRWNSGGVEKEGTVQRIVPCWSFVNGMYDGTEPRVRGSHGKARNHESYVVVLDKPRSRRVAFWPKVSSLEGVLSRKSAS